MLHTLSLRKWPIQQCGFTLAELLVVMILVSIIAVIAVPRFATAPTLDAQTQQLLADLRYTQMLAMTHGQRFRLNFTLPSSYSITNLSGTTVPNPSTGGSSVTFLSGITLSGITNLPNNLVAFDENGIPYTDSAATTALLASANITLTGNGINRHIIITPQTGSMVAS